MLIQRLPDERFLIESVPEILGGFVVLQSELEQVRQPLEIVLQDVLHALRYVTPVLQMILDAQDAVSPNRAFPLRAGTVSIQRNPMIDVHSTPQCRLPTSVSLRNSALDW